MPLTPMRDTRPPLRYQSGWRLSMHSVCPPFNDIGCQAPQSGCLNSVSQVFFPAPSHSGSCPKMGEPDGELLPLSPEFWEAVLYCSTRTIFMSLTTETKISECSGLAWSLPDRNKVSRPATTVVTAAQSTTEGAAASGDPASVVVTPDFSWWLEMTLPAIASHNPAHSCS